MGATAGRRLPVQHAALVVLRQRSGRLLEDGRCRVPPALHAAGTLEVLEESRGVATAAGKRSRKVGHVVLEFREVPGSRNLRGGKPRFSRERRRRYGKNCHRDGNRQRPRQRLSRDRPRRVDRTWNDAVLQGAQSRRLAWGGAPTMSSGPMPRPVARVAGDSVKMQRHGNRRNRPRSVDEMRERA